MQYRWLPNPGHWLHFLATDLQGFREHGLSTFSESFSVLAALAPFGIARRPLRHCSLTQTFRAVLRSQP